MKIINSTLIIIGSITCVFWIGVALHSLYCRLKPKYKYPSNLKHLPCKFRIKFARLVIKLNPRNRNRKIVNVKFLYEDSGFCYEYYKCEDNNRYYIRQGKSCWYSTYGKGGEPLSIVLDAKFVITNPQPKKPSEEMRFKYSLLSRYESDIHYYLGWGKRSNYSLPDPKGHIDEMKKLYKSFPRRKRPKWITLEKINEYERVIFETDDLPYY